MPHLPFPPALLVPLVLASLVAAGLLLRRAVGAEALYRTIVEAETRPARVFDAVLLAAIVLSMLTVILESDPLLRQRWAAPFQALEWVFTLLFTLEYLLRLLCVPQPLRYAASVFGVVDLLAIVPTFLGLLISGAQVFLVVRVLRLLRVFRVLKLAAYLEESELLWSALLAARRKILVFLLTIATLVILIGALMYVVEGPEGGFPSIPIGIYWAVVTITTVGYGDVAPVKPLGRLMASAVMLLGYSIIAVPTGILTAEIGVAQQRRQAETPSDARLCQACGGGGHEADAAHCKHCGAPL
jgi:voltage-gated potassium channel